MERNQLVLSAGTSKSSVGGEARRGGGGGTSGGGGRNRRLRADRQDLQGGLQTPSGMEMRRRSGGGEALAAGEQRRRRGWEDKKPYRPCRLGTMRGGAAGRTDSFCLFFHFLFFPSLVVLWAVARAVIWREKDGQFHIPLRVVNAEARETLEKHLRPRFSKYTWRQLNGGNKLGLSRRLLSGFGCPWPRSRIRSRKEVCLNPVS
jgi:hypothetical protein